MDDVQLSILRILLGIISLIGVLWGAVRYMIKYSMLKQDVVLKEYTDTKVDPVKKMAETTAAEVYDLHDRVVRSEHRIRNLENVELDPEGHVLKKFAG